MTTTALFGLVFCAGVLAGLVLATFTLRSYYIVTLERNIDAYLREIRLARIRRK